MKHVLVFSESLTRDLLSGTLKKTLRFFKKRPDFLDKIRCGDLIFFRVKKEEVLGQFEIGKLIVIEKPEKRDWSWINKIGQPKEFGLTEAEFEEKVNINKVLLIIQITKLEQFITPPIEIDKRSKKEWEVLD